MPIIIARGSDDAVERAEGMDVQGILEREFKSVWDWTIMILKSIYFHFLVFTASFFF